MIKTLKNLLKQDKERYSVPRKVQDVTIFSGCCDSFILFLVVVLSLPKVTDVTVT